MDRNICKITLTATATGQDLTLIVSLDGHAFFEQVMPAGVPQNIQHEFREQDGQLHEITLELRGKHSQHTLLDSAGNITQDRVIQIRDFSLDDIELGHLFHSKSRYHHNFNGTGPETQGAFWGDMGCNGIVTLEFTSPAYLWLLEHT
jgi:hypothetical protein